MQSRIFCAMSKEARKTWNFFLCLQKKQLLFIAIAYVFLVETQHVQVNIYFLYLEAGSSTEYRMMCFAWLLQYWREL